MSGGRVPTKDQLLRHLARSGGPRGEPPSRREVIRELGLRGRDRTEFGRLWRELESEGVVEARPRAERPGDRLPPVAVLEVTGVDEEGELLARPTGSQAATAASVSLPLQGGRGPAPAVGDRVLARLSHLEGDRYEGQIIRRLPGQPRRLLGRLERVGSGLRLTPIDRRGGDELQIGQGDLGQATEGELVVVEREDGQPLGRQRARVVERLGRADEPSALSLLTAHAFDLPLAFPAEAEAQAAKAVPVALGQRRDLRQLPLVTIDGADARDFDDAVLAEPDPDPTNPGGWRVVVAIADVAHYVRSGDALDQAARARGNSVYLPDRVLPMLPAALSNGLCSLRPGEDRACLAAHLRLDARGAKLDHRFERGLMRSQARLTYEQLQQAADGDPDQACQPLLASVIQPLFGAYAALREARGRRAVLDLDLPELAIELDAGGRPTGVAPRPRLDAHRLIEEFMITANVAAAEQLEQAVRPCMYRVHDRPDPVKLEGLGQLLKSLDLVRGSGELATARGLSRLLERLQGDPLAPTISDLVLRAQSQAVYSPRNLGHFGLDLGRYAHFTSPIRRYADLLVHRGLIDALGLGEGGDPGGARDDWRELGTELSHLERRAVAAERAARERFVALWLKDRVGNSFAGSVSGVHRAGLFVRLDDSLAEGLVPIGSLGREYFLHQPEAQVLVGQDTGVVYGLGDRLQVELAEVDVAAGRLSLRLLDHEPGPAARAVRPDRRAAHRRGQRSRQSRGR